MSDFEAIETREQFEEAVKDRLEQERETVRREFSGCLSPEAVEEKYKEYLSPKEAEEKYKGYLSPEDAANKDATIAKYEKESKRVKVAMENGIPYELAGKLSGETEDEMKKDAEAFSKFLKGKTTYPNFTRDTDNKDDSIRVILSRLVDTFISRISLTMLPVPNPHNTVCVLSWEEARHWQSRSSGYSSS